ncbi:MAG TPA: hypothetical protein VN282_17445 [Pyrinomonadaceae bacterium]|nr:hypothetical protein [Pyrinomonadaceae bacterium]
MTEEKIPFEAQRKLVLDFDVPAIRAEMARLLARPRCANFVRELLERVSRNASPGNKLVADGNVLEVFDIVVNEQRGLVRAGDTARGALGGANFADGSIEGKNARIQVGNFTTGAAVTMKELKALYVKSDAQICIHETLHHCGRLVYSDHEYAIAVSSMNGNNPPLPIPPPGIDSRFMFSNYWDQELRKTYN